MVQNALAISVNIPLGLALTDFIIESGIPTIAHHHDFYWERQRFHSFAAMDYLKAAFPPHQPNIQHVVINSLAGMELARRTGASWTLLPNIMDFKILPQEIDDYNRDLRSEIGLESDSFFYSTAYPPGIAQMDRNIDRTHQPPGEEKLRAGHSPRGWRRRALLSQAN